MHFEQYDPQSSHRGSVWMFVAGTAIGALAALMMAPATGRDSRDYIRKRSKKMAGDLSTQADKFASAMKRGQEHASSAVRGTMDSAKAAFNAAKSYRTGETAHPTSASPGQSASSPGQSASSPRPTPARPMTSSPS